MNDYSILLRWLWFGAGFLGVFILRRYPDKILFDSNFWGSMFKTWSLIIMPASIFGGPFTLIIALFLPRKKLCPHCFRVNRKDETICVHCSNTIPSQLDNHGEESAIPEPRQQFSPEVQAAVAKGNRNVSMVSIFLMIGIISVSLFLGVFMINDESGIFVSLGLLLGFVAAWLWWSYSVPRWRQWALKQLGVTEEELQKAAEVAMLVWPKGSFFEKTEFKIKRK